MSDLSEVSILLRREIEARIAGPLIKAFMEELRRAETLRFTSRVVLELAEQSGAELAEKSGGNSLENIAKGTGQWSAGDALEREVLGRSESRRERGVADGRRAADLALKAKPSATTGIRCFPPTLRFELEGGQRTHSLGC